MECVEFIFLYFLIKRNCRINMLVYAYKKGHFHMSVIFYKMCQIYILIFSYKMCRTHEGVFSNKKCQIYMYFLIKCFHSNIRINVRESAKVIRSYHLIKGAEFISFYILIKCVEFWYSYFLLKKSIIYVTQ